MGFNSRTFRTQTGSGSIKSGEIGRATAKHKGEIDTVVEQARTITRESLTKIATIKDPDLRRSAKR